MASNPLDPCSQISTIAADPSNKCDNSVPTSCSDLINLCLCQTDPPESPGNIDSKCVNDIITRPWAPPPPTNPGCNPLSISITNKQDDSGSVSPDNIKLKGSVNYVGKDPCLPELNLELITNPTFFRGGGAPVSRGWGVSYHSAPNINNFRILPEGCPNQNTYSDPQSYFANVPGADNFLPQPSSFDCNTPLDVCKYRRAWAEKFAPTGLIGPYLMKVYNWDVYKSVTIDGASIPYAWKYTLTKWADPTSGNDGFYDPPCHGLTAWPGYRAGYSNQNWEAVDALLPGLYGDVSGPPGLHRFTAYNIKENLNSFYSDFGATLSPGTDLLRAFRLGFLPQPILQETYVLMYGKVPWASLGYFINDNTGEPTQEHYDICNQCKINWFIDIPNAFMGQCPEGLTDGATAPNSMIPTRTVKSAGMFFGGIDVDRV